MNSNQLNEFPLEKALDLIDSDLTNEELLFAVRGLEATVEDQDELIFESVYRIMISKGRHADYGPTGSLF